MNTYKVGSFYSIAPKTEWARKMVAQYGEVCQVVKVGSENLMFANDTCTAADGDQGAYQETFRWGFWLAFTEADFTEVEKVY